MKIYVVTAYRYKNKLNHSYLVGVFNNKQKALNVAEVEEEFRGGKYACEVLEGEINKWKDNTNIMKSVFKVVKGF